MLPYLPSSATDARSAWRSTHRIGDPDVRSAGGALHQAEDASLRGVGGVDEYRSIYADRDVVAESRCPGTGKLAYERRVLQRDTP
jgi:hypothetical protein